MPVRQSAVDLIGEARAGVNPAMERVLDADRSCSSRKGNQDNENALHRLTPAKVFTSAQIPVTLKKPSPLATRPDHGR